MNAQKTKNEELYDRIYELARFQSQVAIATLPIGAGVVGFIAQQEYSIANTAALFLVWLGLAGISASIFMNLSVISMNEPITSNEQLRFTKTSKRAMLIFVFGATFLIISPVGLVLRRFSTSELINVSLSSEALKVSQSSKDALERSIVMSIYNVNRVDFENIKTTITTTSPNCITVSKLKDIPPSEPKGIGIKVWQIRIETPCTLGDNLVQFNLHENGKWVGRSTLRINITP